MIAQEVKIFHKQSDEFPTVSFGISGEKGMAKIFGALRDMVYSDKILAVIREYSCNAIDSHAKNKIKDRPIVITLPNTLSLSFKVRDFGAGMDDAHIRSVFANYGESDKTDNNDECGQFGFGCKSAFAYGENFIIRSYKDGTLRVYNAFIDPSLIGKISKIQQIETAEENGVEIEIPVREADINAFLSKSIDFFQNFTVQPIVVGNSNYAQKKQDVAYQGSFFKILSGTENHSRYYRHEDNAAAVMGGVTYPISSKSITCNDEDSSLLSILNRKIVIDFPIGKLAVSISRESLQYTEETQKNIIESLRKIKTEVMDFATKKFNEGTSMYEAKCLYGEIFDLYGTNSLNFLSGIIQSSDLSFRGKPITSGTWHIDSEKDTTFSIFSRKSKRSRWSSSSTQGRVKLTGQYRNIPARKDICYVINDNGERVPIGKIAPLIERETNHVGQKFNEVIVINPGADYSSWSTDNNFDAPVVNLSSLPKVKLADLGYAAIRSGKSGAANDKHSAGVFSVNWNESRNYGLKSDFYTPTTVDFNAGGIFFVIDRFSPVSFRSDYVCNIKKYCEYLGIDCNKVIAVKVSESGKFKNSKKWALLQNVVGAKIDKMMKKNNQLQKFVDTLAYSSLTNSEDSCDSISKLDLSAFGKGSPVASFIEKYLFMENKPFHEKAQEIKDICEEFRIPEPSGVPSYDLPSEIAKVKKAYPLVKHVSYYWSDDKDSGFSAALTSYFTAIDARNGIVA